MAFRKESTTTTLLGHHNSLYPQICAAATPQLKNLSLQQMEITENSQLDTMQEAKRYWESPAPPDISTLQLLHLWLRKYCRRRDRKEGCKSQNARKSTRNGCTNKTGTLAISMHTFWKTLWLSSLHKELKSTIHCLEKENWSFLVVQCRVDQSGNHIHTNNSTDSVGCTHLYLCNKQGKRGHQLECRAGHGRGLREASWEDLEEEKGDGEVMQFYFN